MTQALNILLVDDDEMLRKLITDQLKIAGVTVNTAISAKDGLEKADKVKPDFILLDFKMSDQRTPEQLAENIEQFQKFAPVVVFTGFKQEIEDGIKGAIGVLSKDGNMRASSLFSSLRSIFFSSDNERLREIDRKIEALKEIIHGPSK